MLKSLSKHQRIRESLLELIKRENLKPGDRILSQSQLAKRFKVNPLTIGKVLTELCEENLLYRENGRGTFVGEGARPKKASGMRKVCLVLPGENLGSRESNPGNWQYVQQWIKTFMECMGEKRIFSPLIVSPGDTSPITLDKIAEFDVCFFLSASDYHPLIGLLLERGISCPVSLGAMPEGLKCLSLPFDRFRNAEKGISHLLSLGYRKIAFVSPSHSWFNSDLKAYRRTMSTIGITDDADGVFQLPEGDTTADILTKWPELREFEAVYATTNDLALDIHDQFQHAGIAVPEEIGIMAGAGLEFMLAQPPHLTAVLYPHKPTVIFALAFVEAHNYCSCIDYSQPLTGEIHPGQTCRQLTQRRRNQ